MSKKQLPYQHKKSGFCTPKHYFDDFSVELPAEETQKPSTLDVEHSAAGFRVPKAYFDDFSVELPPQKGKVITLNQQRLWYKVAAVAAIAVLLFQVFNSQQQAVVEAGNELDEFALESYIDTKVDVKSQDIYFSSDNFDQRLESEINQLDEKSIKNYLEDNVDDVIVLLNDH